MERLETIEDTGNKDARPRRVSGAVDYTAFLERAKRNIGRPGAVAWLSTHGLTEKDAERFGLGYVDPKEDGELVEILNGIYAQLNEGRAETDRIDMVRRLDSPAVIVPYDGGGYWTGLFTSPKFPGAVWWPNAGTPPIWGRASLWASEGEPVLVTADLMDALMFSALGAWAVYTRGGMAGMLADALRARAPSGSLVIMPPTNAKGDFEDDVEAAMELKARLGALGVPAACYDFSNYEGEYTGAAQLMRDQGRDGLRRLLEDVMAWASEDMKGARASYQQGTTRAYLGDFQALIGSRTGREAVPTGFEGLDELLDGGLYPGLYVLGAVSSLGKTTFMLQIADHIAASGRDVLFFSLEQSKDELIAKSLSRMTATLQIFNHFPEARSLTDTYPLTSRQILYRMGDWIGTPQEEALESAMLSYC